MGDKLLFNFGMQFQFLIYKFTCDITWQVFPQQQNGAHPKCYRR